MPLGYSASDKGRDKQTDRVFRQVEFDLPEEPASSYAFASKSFAAPAFPGATVSLEAFCENIIFRNEENGYTVALFSRKQLGAGAASNNERIPLEFTAVGNMAFLEAGDYASLAGRWVVHGTYGQQLQVENYAQITPHTSEDILDYLSSGSIPGIGAKTAERIVSAFGDDSIRIMREEPEKLSRIKGITAAKARQISVNMVEKGDFQELSLLLTPFGIGAGRILSIYKRFGSSSQFVVKNNPFRLADEVNGIGFHTADSLASHFGCDASSPYRIGSAIMYCMLQAENEGHTYLPLMTLLDRAKTLLLFSPEDETVKPALEAGYRQLLDTHKLVAFRMEKDGDFFLLSSDEISDKIRAALPKTLESELASAKMIAGKLQAGNAYPISNEIEDKVSISAEQMGIELAAEQKSAVLTAVHSYVSIITGGPGTGKTTIIRVLTDFFASDGKKIVLCAPTGRAAKRMSEASGVPARTIHRLLEMERGGESNASIVFKRNEENPIEADVVIVDEVSMLDSFLFCCLLRAVGPKSQIIFVGDSDQLPSVGSGNVLADLISSGVIPVERLTQIFRQAAQSRIVLNAHRILSGLPVLFDQSLESDCMLISMSSAPQIAQAVARLCSSVLPNVYGIDVQRDTAVLSPSRKGPSGINALNPLLQEAIGNTGEPHCLSHGFSYRISDKVMQTRNNYDLSYMNQDKTQGTGVFNGEIGYVKEIDTESDYITVEMDDGRTVSYDRTAMDDLEPAYAITVHKSQGSEYPVVILAIAPGSPLLNNRNLLYTAITRAKKKLFIVTSKSTLEHMIKSHAQNNRQTSLCEFLRVYHNESKEIEGGKSE